MPSKLTPRLNEESFVDAQFTERKIAHHLIHEARASWDTSTVTIPEDAVASKRGAGTCEYLRVTEYGLINVYVGHGSISVNVAATSQEVLDLLLDEARAPHPVATPDENKLSVNFWSLGSRGPTSRRRELVAPSWEDIEGNYSARTKEELGWLLSGDFEPSVGGQLILWSGDPGTGKTHALLGLAQEWREWCSIHYITDPDVFFGTQANYMTSVLLDEEDEEDEQPWRLLVLEDTGELLQPDSKDKVGQALSRFLNVVDGLIGKGLRILVLVTTNEESSKLHPAIARLGRCAANIEFAPLTADEAVEWYEAHDLPVGKARTLAELYGELHGFHAKPQQSVGFAV